MSQVIRKYADGGSTQNLDAAPLKILGQYYNPESFRREALGSKAMSYAKAMGFNSDQTHQFISDLKDHVDRIINGTMTFTDEGTLENTDDSWENTGKYAKKKFLGKGLTEEQLRNNRSIDVTNYLIDSLRTGSFSRTKYNSPKSYTMEFDKLFQTKFHPNIDFDDYVKTWDSLDPGDEKTGKRGVTNRLKSIGDLLLGEADKLDNDATYRRQFSWEGWENNWKGRQSSYTQKLRDAAKKLSDGVYSDEDKRYLASIGINLDKYLSTSDEETIQKIEAARKEREAREEKEKEKVRKSHNNGFQSALPWQTKTPVLWWDGNPYTYGSDDYNTLYNNSDVKQYIDTVYADNQNNKLSPDAYYEGYSLPATIGDNDYAVDISDYFPILNGTKSYVIRKDPLDPSTAAVYIPNKNHTNYTRYSIHKKEDGTYYAVPFAGQKVTDGINLGKLNPQAVAHPLTAIHYSSVFAGKDLSKANNLASYFKLRSVTAPISEHFGDAKLLYDWLLSGKSTVKGTGNERAIRMTTENGRYVLLLDLPGYGYVKYYLKQNPGNKPLRYWNLDKVVKHTYKDGGIIKAQAGVRMAPIEPKSTQTTQPTKVDNTTKLYASLSGKENARNQFLAQDTLTGTDLVRLGSAITDLTSAVAGFVPGLNIASTATGMASSLTDFGADMTDLANDRKGVSFLDSLGTLGLNLGMDAVSLLPGLKSFKAASAIKRIASYVPHIAGAIQTYNLITDDNLKRSVGETLAKISSLDVSRLNTQDFRNLAYLGRTILGVKGAYKQITSRKTKATGNVEVGGTVKVNGETKKITASIPKEQIKTFSKNDKVAREALVEAANKKFGKPKTDTEEGLSFSDKDITLNTNTIGKVRTSTIREELNNNDTPKKVFEGWFGSKGLNWKFSDYKLSKNNSIVAKLYGFETPEERINRINSTRDQIHKEVENKGIVKYIKEQATENSEIANKIQGKSDKEILELFPNKEKVVDFVSDIASKKWPGMPFEVTSDGKILVFPRTSGGRNTTLNVADRYFNYLRKYDAKVKSDADKYHILQAKDRERTANLEGKFKVEAAKRKAYENAAKQLKAQNDELLAQRLKEIKDDRTKRLIYKGYTSQIIPGIVPKPRIVKPLSGAARKAKEEMYNKLFGPVVEADNKKLILERESKRRDKNIARRQASEKNYNKYANIIGKQLFNGWNKMNPSTKKKLIQDNKKVFDDAIKEYKMQEYFARMNPNTKPFAVGGILAKYKTGGSFIPKFGDSGIIDYLNYDNPYIKDISDIYSVIGLDPNQQFQGFKGTSNTKTWNNGNMTLTYPNEWYDTNHKSVVDITTNDVFNELKKYHESDNGSHIFGDVTNAYNTWHGTNTNGSVEDFINYYNNSVSQLRKWAKEKSTLPYNTLGQGDKNDLFNTLYKSYTVGFDENQKDVLGPGTYRRIPNQFANLNEFKNNRIGKLGDKKVWIDNAGYLRIGEYGKVTPTSKKTEKKDPERGTKTVGGVNVDPSGILGLTEVITGMTANTQATKKLMESTPTLKQAPWINRYIFGNYPALSRALQSAGELNTQASTPISSDAALAYAAQLEANAKGRELIDTGNQRNFETYWTSRNNVQQGNELNETNAINVANENNAAANAMRNAKLKWQADLITSNVSGNIKPWLSEQRSYMNQNNALKRKYELNYALKLSTQQAAMNQEQLMKKYLDEAKENAKANNIDITDKSDDAIISDYFERNPEVKEAYNSELRKIQRDAYKSQFDLYTNINRIPIGLGFTYQPKRTLVYNPNLEQYVESNKKGGSLTAKDRIKIQQEKDFNKKMLSDSKESIKSIRENIKEFHKTYRSMSAGTLALIKKAMQ